MIAPEPTKNKQLFTTPDESTDTKIALADEYTK